MNVIASAIRFKVNKIIVCDSKEPSLLRERKKSKPINPIYILSALLEVSTELQMLQKRKNHWILDAGNGLQVKYALSFEF